MSCGDSERAGDVDQHVLVRRVDDAGGNHGVLLGDRREHLVEVQLEVGELLRREAQVHLLVLIAEDLDLADVRRAQELGPRRLGEVACLARREAVIGDAVDDAEDVAELVVEEGPDHALRQRHLDVADLLADLVPDVLDLVARRRLLQIDEDGRLAGLGVALEVVEVGGFLELLLEPVRQLREGVGHARARPGGLDDHGLDREVGVLFAAQPLVGAQSADEADEHEEDGDGPVVHGPFGKVEARHHWSSVSGFTSWPSASELTPAVTTISPGARPAPTTTDSMSNSRSSTARRCTWLSSDTTQTCGTVSGLQERGGGQGRDLLALGFGAADDDGAEAHLRRRRRQRDPHLVGARGAVGHRRDLADGAGDRHVGLRLQPYLDRHAERRTRDIRAGDGEDRLALGIARDLDHHLPCLHDLPRVRAGRGDDAIVRGKQLGVAELVLGDAKIRFGRLHGRLGAPQRLQQFVVDGARRVALVGEDAIAFLLCRDPGERRPGGGEVGLGGDHLVLEVGGAERARASAPFVTTVPMSTLREISRPPTSKPTWLT